MKSFKYIVAAGIVSLGITSCNDILDVNNTTQFSDAVIWGSANGADGYVVAAYQTFTDYSQLWNINTKFYDGYSDLFKSISWDAFEHLYNKSAMEETRFGKNNAGVFDCWGTAYGRIKRTNLLLNDIDRYGGKYGEDWQNIRRAEARFCNAINYWFIARVYGGAVIRTDHSGSAGLTDDGAYPEDCNRARVSEQETYDYILSELQWAADNLPEKWEDKFIGRATKGIAYGFMSRIALYGHRWDIAVEAADKCEEYGGYDLVKDYASLFDCKNDVANRKEVIYAIYGLKNVKTHEYDAAMRPFGDGAVYNLTATAYGRLVPTAELADMYDFKDGKEFDWKTYKSDGHQDPYTDREPRFHATILYDGAKWEDREIQTYVGSGSAPDGADSWAEYKNSSSTQGHTCTGYYTRKYLQENNKTYNVDKSWNTEIVLRFAEVLLNKAEALAQLDQIDEALKPLNRVRQRVGLPDRTRTDAPDKDAFMELLRKERICELAGEGLRLWDLRRWKLAKEVIDGKMFHGVKITRRASGTKTYSTIEVDANTPRIFQDRYYYYSLPNAELTNNKLCEDNPGW